MLLEGVQLNWLAFRATSERTVFEGGAPSPNSFAIRPDVIPFLCDVTAFSLGSPMDSRFLGNDGGGGATACDLRRSHSELV